MPSLQDALYWFNQDIQGAWYGWIDTADGEVYSNLNLINDDATMPTEEQVNAKIAELQADLDYQNLDYVKALEGAGRFGKHNRHGYNIKYFGTEPVEGYGTGIKIEDDVDPEITGS